ncbi:30S ribosomal protein S12 methylthiotransferase RimO [Pseudothermotoga thermarum]|uniref:Ribosomal protein uS12 methylthiotransferase RimO n=1 Tax=Pseudothermotoga thermarum DSM 5069 TaxID=688269 RepID=F7YWQ5_9THEM|nr:30S ribosomal protein S12 methylthiotransferase RimO [Pseudothermotoga thermarum]AEH52045.1 SSU ribosomal protein S12P methylthiotransferase [Pseudothermotoga thermarum DSM 5069]
MKIGIKVLGCPKNEADCNVLEAILRHRGHEIVKDAKKADVIIIDTCAFIEDAKKEAIDEILTFAQFKSKHNFFLCVKGCLVQRYADELAKEIPEVDAWYGILPPSEVADAVENRVKFLVKDPITVYEESSRCEKGKTFAYIKIADGCDRACTFCSIPAFKGAFKSRTLESIEKEAAELIEQGVKELILVAQDTTAYGVDLYGKPSLPTLLERLNKLEKDFTIRVMYLHPDHLTDEIIEAMLGLEKVLPYLDIPVQHGSDKILKRMGRTKTAEQLLELIEKIRKINPDSAIRTSIIVGFPGETDEDFEQLLNFLQEAKFDRLGCFIYSEEEGTVASQFPEKVPHEVASQRQEEVMLLQSEISEERLKRFLNKKLRILVESSNKNYYIGRSHLDAPEIDGVVLVEKTKRIKPKDFYTVLITSTTEYDLKGVLVE